MLHTLYIHTYLYVSLHIHYNYYTLSCTVYLSRTVVWTQACLSIIMYIKIHTNRTLTTVNLQLLQWNGLCLAVFAASVVCRRLMFVHIMKDMDLYQMTTISGLQMSGFMTFLISSCWQTVLPLSHCPWNSLFSYQFNKSWIGLLKYIFSLDRLHLMRNTLVTSCIFWIYCKNCMDDDSDDGFPLGRFWMTVWKDTSLRSF